MKKINEHLLFVFNALLIAGLIAAGFWLQQNNSSVVIVSPNTQIVSAASSETANSISITVPSDADAAAQSTTAQVASSTVPAHQQITVTPSPVVRRPRENEGRYDE